MTEGAAIAVIGGSGLYSMPQFVDARPVEVDTPFGKPSAAIMVGSLAGKRVAFLPRHGIGHVYSPSVVPYRANIYALKSLGVRFIIAVNACGSLREDYAPGDIVIPDQLIDMTKQARGRSFFETGLVAHVGTADPFSPELAEQLYQGVLRVGGTAHRGGTFVIIEGPRFSTKAESHLFRSWGCSIVGMTTIPEVFLAREAEIAYATMAHVTDYDVWHATEEAVSVDMVIRTMHQNLTIAQRAIMEVVEALDERAEWPSHRALDNAITTARGAIPADEIRRLGPITARMFPPGDA